jgi:hypothetical protein
LDVSVIKAIVNWIFTDIENNIFPRLPTFCFTFFQLLKRLSLLEQISKSPVIAVATTPEPSDVASDIANDNIVNDENENVRKRKRGRPATKDKSVGTGPSQPSVNKAVQV